MKSLFFIKKSLFILLYIEPNFFVPFLTTLLRLRPVLISLTLFRDDEIICVKYLFVLVSVWFIKLDTNILLLNSCPSFRFRDNNSGNALSIFFNIFLFFFAPYVYGFVFSASDNLV